MVCSHILTITNWSDFLVWPVGCDYYFYLKFFLVLFVVLAWGLYKAEKRQKQSAEFLSSMGVSSIAIVFLAVICTLIKDSQNIPMVSAEVLLYILAPTIPIILIWIFKK